MAAMLMKCADERQNRWKVVVLNTCMAGNQMAKDTGRTGRVQSEHPSAFHRDAGSSGGPGNECRRNVSPTISRDRALQVLLWMLFLKFGKNGRHVRGAAQPVQIDQEARAAMLWKEMCAARGNVSIKGKITYSVIRLACGQNGTGR